MLRSIVLAGALLAQLSSAAIVTFTPCGENDVCCLKKAPGAFSIHPPCPVRVSISSASAFAPVVYPAVLVTDSTIGTAVMFNDFVNSATQSSQNVFHVHACGDNAEEREINTAATISWLFTPQRVLSSASTCTSALLTDEYLLPLNILGSGSKLRANGTVAIGWTSTATSVAVADFNGLDVGRVLINPVDIRYRFGGEWPLLSFNKPLFVYQTPAVSSCMFCFDTVWNTDCGNAESIWDSAMINAGVTEYSVTDSYTGLLTRANTNACTAAAVNGLQLRFATQALTMFSNYVRNPQSVPVYQNCASVATGAGYNRAVTCRSK